VKERIVSGRGPYTVRLPGFLAPDREVGLGEAVRRATSLAGIRPCAGCEQRAEAMNHWLAFAGRRGERG
jgi:hypothetical protein